MQKRRLHEFGSRSWGETFQAWHANAKRKTLSGQNVVDLDAKRSEKLTAETVALVQQTARLLDEQVRLIVAANSFVRAEQLIRPVPS